MKYYSISRSDDIKVIGNYPQTSLKKGYNPRLFNSYWQVKKDEFPDFIPNLELELHNKATPTDYLHFINLNHGLIISGKMKDILKRSHLSKHHFYPIKVYHKDALLDYYWFHFIVDDFWDFLEKKKSYAEIKKMITPITYVVDNKIPIISREQIIKEEYKLTRTDILAIGHIKMKKGFPLYDFYKIACLSYNTIISESLKDALEKEGITGMEIKPFDKFSVEE